MVKENSFAWHRQQQVKFIAKSIQFSADLSADQTEVRNAYQDWIDQPHNRFNAPAIGILYDSLVSMGATRDDKTRTFHGIGLLA